MTLVEAVVNLQNVSKRRQCFSKPVGEYAVRPDCTRLGIWTAEIDCVLL